MTTNKCSRADMSARACPAFTAEENAFYIKKGFGIPCNIFRRAADKGSPFCTNRRGGEIWIIPERPSKGRYFRSRGPNDLCWPYNCGSTGRAARWEFDYEEGWIPVHRNGNRFVLVSFGRCWPLAEARASVDSDGGGYTDKSLFRIHRVF